MSQTSNYKDLEEQIKLIVEEWYASWDGVIQ